MIHFFPRFSRSAEDTPLGRSLREMGVAHRIIGSDATQRYRYRLQLLLLGYPKLAWSALSCAVRSMYRSTPRPDAAVISSDVEALMFAVVRALPFAARPRLVFVPFIFTQRSNPALNRVRLLYYRFVMRRISCAICHSTLEVERYTALFAGCGTDFVYVPWGGYVPSPAEVEGKIGPRADPAPRVVAAGRSGRDYPTLAAATAEAGCALTIICNEVAGLGGVKPSASVEILTNTFGFNYLGRVLHADVVVVPLRVADISAGQMVLIQAMALARPLIVTETPTVGNYLEHGVTALLVPLGDVTAMTAAIRQLLDDPDAAAAMGRRARAAYDAKFSNEAHQPQMVAAIQGHLARG